MPYEKAIFILFISPFYRRREITIGEEKFGQRRRICNFGPQYSMRKLAGGGGSKKIRFGGR